MSAADVGKTTIDEILGTLPADRRTALQEHLEAAPEFVTAIGAGVLRQQEYSRIRDQQTEWWNANRELAELGQKAKAAGFDPSKPATPPAPPSDVVRREELEQRDSQSIALGAYLSGLAVAHFNEFKEVLDVQGIIANPEAAKVGIPKFYETMVAGRRAEAQKAAIDADVARRVEEGVAARMKSAGHPSYPTGTVEDTSPLAALTPAPDKGASVEAMTDMYQQLVATSR